MLFQWSIAINPDQCRIKFPALTPMPVNKYQCRSRKINTNQYFSILLNADQCWSIPINAGSEAAWSALIGIERQWHWSPLIGIDPYREILIIIDLHWSALIFIEINFGSMSEIWSGIDRYWSALIIDPACPVIRNILGANNDATSW